MSLVRARALLLASTPPVAATVTWNPADTDANITFSNANLTATATAAGDRMCRATSSRTSGKYYFEILTGASWVGGDTGFGLCKGTATGAELGDHGGNGIIYFTGIALWNGASLGSHGLGSTGGGTVVGCAVDLDNNLVWFTKDGVTWTYAGDPAAGTNGRAGQWTVGNAIFPVQVFGGNGNSINGRFKSADFTLTPPSGFSAWQ